MTAAGKLEWEDVKLVNINQFVCIEKMKSMSPEDLEYLEETFVTFLSDGQEFELEFNGRNVKLTDENKHHYFERTKEVHLAHLLRPFERIRAGLLDSIWASAFQNRTPAVLEQLICGMDYVGPSHSRSTWTS